MATTGFAEKPKRFNWGSIASSDNHRARPRAGYKEVARRLNTEAGGAITKQWLSLLDADKTPKNAQIHVRNRTELLKNASLALAEFERQGAFWLTGGLALLCTPKVGHANRYGRPYKGAKPMLLQGSACCSGLIGRVTKAIQPLWERQL